MKESIEYRLRAVTRHVLTKHVTTTDVGSVGATGPRVVGEFPSLSAGANAGRAFAMHDRWEISGSDSREVIFDDPWSRACAHAERTGVEAPGIGQVDAYFELYPDAAFATWPARKADEIVPTSRFAKGSEVIFQPNLALIDGRLGTCIQGGTRAKVVGVEFGLGKVYYDLALDDCEGGFYDAAPLRRVDSCFVCPELGPARRFVLVKSGFEVETVAYYAEQGQDIRQLKADLEARHGGEFRVFERTPDSAIPAGKNAVAGTDSSATIDSPASAG